MNQNCGQERTTPKPPTFSFVTITNPKESKTRSKKRAVRSHVAYYQHHKDDDNADVSSPHRKSNKRVTKTEDSPITPRLSSESSSDSINFHLLRSAKGENSPGTPWLASESSSSSSSINFDILLAGSEFDALGSGYGSSPLPASFSGTRIDPFQSYPVPWKQFYDPILDFYLTYILIDTPGIDQAGRMFLLRTDWFPFIMKNATTFYAALAFAGSIYYFRLKRPVEAPRLLDLRQKAILGINDSLSKIQYGPEDATIGAVFCMSLLESMYGDAQSYRVHMKGLQRMVQMRGGLTHLGLQGLLERMILWLDFNHAKVHKTALFFGESLDVSKRPSPFKHPKDSTVVDTGSTKILR